MIATGAVVGVGAGSATAASPTLTSTPYGDLAKALQMSIYFYDAEKSGPARSMGRQPLEWRDDSEPVDAHIPLTPGTKDSGGVVESGTNLPAAYIEKYRSVLDPDGDGTLDLSQGFHDAGDHVKFGLPQGYTASTLAWGVYEFEDAYKKTGTYDHIMDQLYWFSDYFLKSTFRDSSGNVVAFNYQVGNGSSDHGYWGPPEFQTTPRGAMFAYIGAGASDQAAQAGASLVAMSLLTEETDPSYSKKCFETGKALYEFAVANRGIGESGGYYGSAYDEDELSWAATWLYLATGDMKYVEDITAKNSDGTYKGYMKKIVTTLGDTWQNIWVHSWDVVWGGTFALLAPATQGKVDEVLSSDLWYYFRWNIEYWTSGAVEHIGKNPGGGSIGASPAGYSVVAGWGSARYNAAAQLCAMVYAKHADQDPDGAAGHGDKLAQWALSQMNYILGDNPLHRSYEVGFTAKDTDTHVMHPHHRAAHGSETNSMTDPENHKHTLWGALAGGPGMLDEHKDLTTDYVYNEVAIDYNAGFVGALAAEWLYFQSDQKVEKWTPPLEPDYRKWWSSARLEQENNQRTQVTIQVEQHFSTPPRRLDDLKVRYYFDISELVAVGQTIADVKAELYYDEHSSLTLEKEHVTLSQPVKYGTTGNVYYVEVSWEGCPFWGKRQVQFGIISAQDANYADNWDPTNDYSRPGLPGPKEDLAETGLITTYFDGVLVDGTEPDGTKPELSVTPTPTDSTKTTKTTKTTSSTKTTKTTSTTKTTKTTSTKKSSTKCKNTKKCTPTTTSTKKSSTKCKNTKKCTPVKSSSSTKKKSSTKKNAVSAACRVTTQVTDSWPGGFAAQVTVNSTDDAGMPGWAVRWSAPGTTLTQVSGASLTPDGTDSVLRGLDDDLVIRAGQARTFSVVGTTSGVIIPTVSCSA